MLRHVVAVVVAVSLLSKAKNDSNPNTITTKDKSSASHGGKLSLRSSIKLVRRVYSASSGASDGSALESDVLAGRTRWIGVVSGCVTGDKTLFQVHTCVSVYHCVHHVLGRC